VAAVYNENQMRLYALAVITILIVVAVDVACDRVPLTAPTASTINVTVDQTTLPLNGQATVRAVVIESGGTPVHNGTQVTFATVLGSFAPPTSTTVDGVATTTFLAGSISGSTKINAYSGGASTGSGNSSSGGVTVLIGAAAAKSLSVSATPSSVSQSGGTVTIAAMVMDESGNPLPGVNVTFSADSGQLNPVAALSDSSGIARTQLTTTQTSKVTATAGAATKDVTVTVSAAPTVAINDLSANPVAGQPVSFTVSTTSGNSTAARQVQTLDVSFGDGTSETRSNVTGTAAFTHTYSREGAYTISARAVDVGGNTGLASKAIVVGFAAQPTASISSNKNPVSMSAPDNGVVILSVSGAASSTSGAPIRDVRVTAQDGSVIYQNSGPVSSASVPYRFADRGTYTFRVTATDANGQSATASTVIFVTP
jgi:adhesin/invasin